MNQKLQNIFDLIQQSETLNAEQKDILLKAVKDADKELEITAFKLERTEKVKKTTAILLEETIEELEQKRKVVEQHNRELEIEASLERVRTFAMSMSKSEDLLNICEASFKEFQKLGFNNLRNSIIHIPYDEQKYFMDYDYSEFTGGAITKIKYGSHPIVDEYLAKIRSSEDAYFEVVISKNQLEGWKDFRKKSGQIDDPRLDSATALYYYLFSIGIGDIGISAFKPIDDSQIKILKRFRNVFDLAYRRYNDIALAEAQARESQIQLALERVRAKTMAMHKSEELSETSFVLFKQLEELGESAEQISIMIYNEKEEVIELYATIYGNQWEETGKLPIKKNSVHKKIYEAWKQKKKSIVVDLSGEDLIEFNKFKMDYSNQYKSEDELPKNRWVVHNAFFSKGVLTFSTHETRPVETINLLMRFASVFDLTYTRFLDLQKAEVQAREVQIELSLERVRARTMAMQRSEELAETAAVLFQQLNELGYVPDRITIGIVKEDIRSIELWSTDQVGNEITNIFKPSIDEPTTWSKIYSNWKAKKRSVVIDLSGKELNEWIRYVREEMHLFVNEEVLKENRRVHSVGFFSQGFIMMSTIEALPQEKINVLERFSLVFNQTYTRFLDLQKAEAQAREAQIEVTLERVRSRTMGMQHSDELADAAAVVFQQLINLGIEPNRIYIAIINDEKGNTQFWITDENGSKVNTGFTVNLNENFSFKKMYSGWKEQKKSITIDMKGEELEEYFSYLGNLNVPFKKNFLQKRRIQSIAYFSKGFIGVASPDETKQETIQLLERFAAVFNLTYTRYNDLKQAEAQNRIIQAENDRKTKELEDARQLQLSMLPKELPQLPNLDIAVYMKTATEVGGDYYDFSVNNNGTLTVLVGDATGHGMMSGMMVSIMKSFFISNKENIELKQFFENSNNSIKDMHLGRLMMPLIGVQINSEKLIATNAGMPSLIYFRNKSQKAGEFVSNNLPLGGMKGTKYLLKEIKYEKGDTILLMSDGFAELKNKNQEQYGYTRVKEKFLSITHNSSAEIVEELKNTASQWLKGKETDDDITFVVLKFK